MDRSTPESDFSIECFQNYTAPEVFIQGLAGIVDQQDVESMIRAQKQMLQRFEKTNEMLTNCNSLSASRLKTVAPEFKKHAQLLLDMKRDLDYIFKKVRAIKTKLSAQYPDEFTEAQRNSLAEECEEEEEGAVGQTKEENPNTAAQQSVAAEDNSKRSRSSSSNSDSGACNDCNSSEDTN